MEKPETSFISVWIVEDDLMFRSSLMRTLNRRKELECSAGFSSHEEMFKHAAKGNPWPHVVLMDIELVGASGLEGIRKLYELAPEVRSLVLTVFSSKEKLYAAIEAGASGYLLKRSSASEIVRGIQDVIDGETVLDNQVIKYILDNVKTKAYTEITLTPKEKEVMVFLSKGYTVATIATNLNISVHTVDTHIRRIYKKMGVHSQTAAVACAVRSNLL